MGPTHFSPHQPSRDRELQIVKEIWRKVQEEQTMCEHRHCVGGRTVCVKLKAWIESQYSEILSRESQRPQGLK